MVLRARNLAVTVGLCFLLAVVGGSALAEHGGYGGYFGTDYDFGGKTVYIWTHTEAAGEFDRFRENYSADGRIQEAEELFNCKIELKTASHVEMFDVLMNRLLSGETTNDIWKVLTRYYWHLLANNALYPVGNILPESYYEGLPIFARNKIRVLEYKGQNYVFSQETGYYDIQVGEHFVCFYNKDLFEREGLRDPYELYLEGNWTWEEYGKCIEKLTKDLDGDGVIDQYGMSNPGNWLTQAWLASNGGKITEIDENGRVNCVIDSEANRETLAQLYDWFVVKQWVRRGDHTGPFQTGQAATFVGQLWFVYTIKNTLNAEWGFVPVPKGPRVDDYKYQTFDLNGWVLPINVENPEALMALQEFLFRDDPDDNMEEAMNTYQWAYPSRELAELAIKITNDWDGSSGYIITTDEFDNLVKPTFQQIINGSKTYQEAVDTVFPQLQTMLDEAYNF